MLLHPQRNPGRQNSPRLAFKIDRIDRGECERLSWKNIWLKFLAMKILWKFVFLPRKISPKFQWTCIRLKKLCKLFQRSLRKFLKFIVFPWNNKFDENSLNNLIGNYCLAISLFTPGIFLFTVRINYAWNIKAANRHWKHT